MVVADVFREQSLQMTFGWTIHTGSSMPGDVEVQDAPTIVADD